MLGSRIAVQLAIVRAHMVRKLAHLLNEILRRCAQLNKMSNARGGVESHPIDEVCVIPKGRMLPDGMEVAAERELCVWVAGLCNRLRDVAGMAELEGARPSMNFKLKQLGQRLTRHRSMQSNATREPGFWTFNKRTGRRILSGGLVDYGLLTSCGIGCSRISNNKPSVVE